VTTIQNGIKVPIMTRFKISNSLFSSSLWVLGLALAGPASAHHSVRSEFDVHKSIAITGTIAKVKWINPHSHITVNVKDADGKVQQLGFELREGVLRRGGMSRADGVA
jgi:hypothetical protein